MNPLNPVVTQFLDELAHPFREEIDQVRGIILESYSGLQENIKWNAPNYHLDQNDIITLKIHPPKMQVQVILHRGAKKQEQPTSKWIDHPSKLLVWKENDRAILTFDSLEAIKAHQQEVTEIIQAWIKAIQSKH